MDHYRVTYARREDLRRDLATQIERGGLYVLAYGARRGRCPAEAVRQMAKGVGAPPHIAQAARKRVLG